MRQRLHLRLQQLHLRLPRREAQVSTLAERFWSGVDRREPDECWEWARSRTRQGYGQMFQAGKNPKRPPAHRVSYELHYGPIPEGLVIDHKCHNRACVNPRHLQAVTQKQNNENRVGTPSNNVSGVRGVSWSKRDQKWRAYASHYGKILHVGFFERLEDAAEAVVAKRNELYTNNLFDREIAA